MCGFTMRSMAGLLAAISASVALVAPHAGFAAEDGITGSWSATAEVGGAEIPFRLDLAAHGQEASGAFFDGPRRTNPSTAGRFINGRLHLDFPSYAAAIDAEVAGDQLEGTYVAAGRTTKIRARRGWSPPKAVPGAPVIAGEWIVPYDSPKGEKAWRLIIQQKDGVTDAAILRIDGDTGDLNGGFRDGVFHLSHFAGERAASLDIAVQPDKTLKLTLTDGSGVRAFSALRAQEAATLGAVPTDPTRHTRVKEPAKPLRFSFPDLSGRTISNTDAQFRGKVVVVDVMGSWCPNCHDEAPFLEALYAKYHAQGLEIVALDFEQPDQLADPERLRAFIARYGLTYTVLLAGQPKEVNDKLPQAENLNAWPTTFFIGRDGLVKAAHVGFTSPGSGPRDAETRAEVETTVKRLLSANPVTAQAAQARPNGF